MAEKTYGELLKDPRWQQKRLEILSRDFWTCTSCSDTKTTLHVHHKRYKRGAKPWEYEDDDLITLCEPCHATATEDSKAIAASLSKLPPGYLSAVRGFIEGLSLLHSRQTAEIQFRPLNGNHARGAARAMGIPDAAVVATAYPTGSEDQPGLPIDIGALCLRRFRLWSEEAEARAVAQLHDAETDEVDLA